MEQIQEIGDALLELGDVNVIISGHTDKQPFQSCAQEESDQLNIQLSKDRAVSVADYLVKSGIPRNRIETHGYGPTQPLVKGDNEGVYRQNRRVTIEVR